MFQDPPNGRKRASEEVEQSDGWMDAWMDYWMTGWMDGGAHLVYISLTHSTVQQIPQQAFIC